MISLAQTQNRRSPACSHATLGRAFPRPPMRCKFGAEAHPSSKHRASVCQNRYPTPSRRSGPDNRVRLSFSCVFGQTPAEIGRRTENALANAPVLVVPALRVCANDPEGGRQTCRKHYHSYSSQRCLDLQLATRAAILNVRFCLGPLAVRLAKSLKTANVLQAQRLALPAGHWPTTSDLAAPRGANDTRAVRRICRVALFCSDRRPDKMGDAPCSKKS